MDKVLLIRNVKTNRDLFSVVNCFGKPSLCSALFSKYLQKSLTNTGFLFLGRY